jgi:hypothetical protein
MILQCPQISYTTTPSNTIHPYTWTPHQASLNHALSIPYPRQPPIRPGIRQRRRAERLDLDLVSAAAQPLEKAKTYNTYMTPAFQKSVHKRWINQPNAQEEINQNCSTRTLDVCYPGPIRGMSWCSDRFERYLFSSSTRSLCVLVPSRASRSASCE